jgi:hypothetical protein
MRVARPPSAARRARATRDFQIPGKEIQIFRNEIQANAWISFAESSLIRELHRPPRLLFFLGRLSGLKGAAAAWATPVGFGYLSLLLSSFRFLRFLKQVKGWRLFDRGRLGAICPTCRPRALLREKGNPGSTGPRAHGRRQGDRSDVRQEYVRLKGARSGLEPLAADGRQPFMPYECLTMPAFEFYSPQFAA